MDMATREELIANRFEEPEMAVHMKADSLAHISVGGLLRAIRATEPGYLPRLLHWPVSARCVFTR